MDKIIILSIHGIGDAIMLTPMIQVLREERPASKITVLTTLEGSKQIFETCPYIDEVIKVERTLFDVKDKCRLYFYLKRQNFDVCITAFCFLNILNNIFAGCIKARYRIGYSYSHGSIMGLSFVQNIKIPMLPNEHSVNQNLNLLKPVNISPESKESLETKMWFTEEDIAAGKNFLSENRITDKDMVIGIHPGSSDDWWMICKRWPKDKFAMLGDRLLHEYSDAKVLLFGGPKEEKLKTDIWKLMVKKPIIVSDMSLREVATLIKRCNIFISNDSGLMHIASAMKTPTVAVFGPTNPVATVPYGSGHTVVTEDIDCRPCWPKNKCKYKPPYICLNKLSVSKVFEATKSLIQENFLTWR